MSTRCAQRETISVDAGAWARGSALVAFLGGGLATLAAGVPAIPSAVALGLLAVSLIVDLVRLARHGTTCLVYRHNSRRLTVTDRQGDTALFVDRCQWFGRRALALHTRSARGAKRLIFLSVPTVDGDTLRRLRLWQRSWTGR